MYGLTKNWVNLYMMSYDSVFVRELHALTNGFSIPINGYKIYECGYRTYVFHRT